MNSTHIPSPCCTSKLILSLLTVCRLLSTQMKSSPLRSSSIKAAVPSVGGGSDPSSRDALDGSC